jgi:hypothetical protein
MGLEASRGGSKADLAASVVFFDLKFLFLKLNKFEFIDVIILVHLDLLLLDLDLSSAGGNLNLFLKDLGLLVMKLF